VLILALVMMAVLTIVLTVALADTSESGRHASRSNADERAYGLAEAGINNALAQLATYYPASALPTSPCPVASVTSPTLAAHTNGNTWSGSCSGSSWTL
jgi:Tfp pilus assembly protein PilX